MFFLTFFRSITNQHIFQGQRSLPCNIAIEMWNVVFSRNPPVLLEPWLEFLQENNVSILDYGGGGYLIVAGLVFVYL